MNKIVKINNIVKESLSYDSNSRDELSEGKFEGRLDYNISKKKNKDKKNIENALLDFKLLLKKESHNDDFNQGIEKFNKDEPYVYITFKYNIFYTILDENSEVEESELIYYLEPYIRKELMTTSLELEIPKIPLPMRFWENE
ncbi:hypothetical protein ACTWP4_18555 [Gracilibacillus sp. D59]|uniref:hypothetical protein n=1 Tax=Gracilibacillus sp. D59 TaxID=3457434 RepID=UPI003FCD174E